MDVILKFVPQTLLSFGLSITSCSIFAATPAVENKDTVQTSSMLEYAPACESVQPESQLLNSIQKKLTQNPEKNQKIITKFWESVAKQGTPFVKKIDQKQSRVIYLWRGAKHNVRLIGGPSNDHEWLTRLAKTDIWFKEAVVDNEFIGSYSFGIDLPNLEGYLSHYCPHLNPDLKESREQRRAILKVQQLDPYNKNKFLKEKNQLALKNDPLIQLRNENIVALAQAPQFIDPQQFQQHVNPELRSYTLSSQTLNNDRVIQIYQSKRKNLQQDYITALFFDGKQYSTLLNVAKALDILVEQGKIPPIQAVFISHPSDALRPKELTPNAEYSQFFSQELLPWLDQHLTFPRNKQKTVLLGSSLGGLSSAYLAYQFPNEISHVVPMSGSFWWKSQENDQPNGMSQIIRQSNTQKHPLQHWYISANSYEYSRNNNSLSILETAPIVAQDLKDQGQDVVYKSYVGGHSYAIWQVILQDALLHFFANSATVKSAQSDVKAE